MDNADDEDDEIVWRGTALTFDEAAHRAYPSRREIEWYRTQVACHLLATLQAEAALQTFKDRLRELLEPAVPRRRPSPRHRRRPGPRRVAV
uniref:hypothetical protein n=1 Tax=Pseudonocardia sp. CA-138482 TaxID=3240023 RepID=UPI003F494C93